MIIHLSDLQTFASTILADAHWGHFAVIGMLSLALTGYFLVYKKCSVYGAIVLGITVLIGLFLLDLAVVIRLDNKLSKDIGLNLAAEYHRFIHADVVRRVEMLSNVAAFIPFGFFLSELLSEKKRFGIWRRIGNVALIGFGLSLCIECLQLILRVGIFELTDMVLNTAGAFIGAVLSILGRMAFGIDRNKTS